MQCYDFERRKQLKGPKGVTIDESLHDKNKHVENVEKEVSTPSKEVIDDVVHKSDEVLKDPKITSPKPYPHLYHFHKGWLKQDLNCNLEVFRSP